MFKPVLRRTPDGGQIDYIFEKPAAPEIPTDNPVVTAFDKGRKDGEWSSCSYKTYDPHALVPAQFMEIGLSAQFNGDPTPDQIEYDRGFHTSLMEAKKPPRLNPNVKQGHVIELSKYQR